MIAAFCPFGRGNSLDIINELFNVGIKNMRKQ